MTQRLVTAGLALAGAAAAGRPGAVGELGALQEGEGLVHRLVEGLVLRPAGRRPSRVTTAAEEDAKG